MAAAEEYNDCESLLTTENLLFTPADTYNVTLTSGKKQTVIAKEIIGLNIQKPIELKKLVKKINKNLNPTVAPNLYTYAIISINDVLKCKCFKETSDFDIIKITLLEKLKEYIIKEEFIVFVKEAVSKLEIFNKHLHLAAQLKNIILLNLCQYVNLENFNEDIRNMYYKYGSAGEMVIDNDTLEEYTIYYNILSGSLMIDEYNTEMRINIAYNIFNIITQELDSSYEYNIEYITDNIVNKSIDMTNDIKKLIDLGNIFYKIENSDVFNKKKKMLNKMNLTKLIIQRKIRGIKHLFFSEKSFAKEHQELIKVLSNYENNLIKMSKPVVYLEQLQLIYDILSELSEKGNIRLKNLIMDAYKIINNINKEYEQYLIIQNEIEQLYDSSIILTKYELKRKIKGGRKSKRKSKRKGQRMRKSKRKN